MLKVGQGRRGEVRKSKRERQKKGHNARRKKLSSQAVSVESNKCIARSSRNRRSRMRQVDEEEEKRLEELEEKPSIHSRSE